MRARNGARGTASCPALAGNVDAAIHLLTDAVAVFERTFGHEHPRVASACAVLAYAKNAKGDRAAAEKLYRRALSINENAYGPRHDATLASVKDLAGFFRTAGRAKDAAELERRLH